MICRQWVNPNFQFHARDREGVEYQFFCHAESAGTLEARLKEKNLTVDWVQPYDFCEWKARARAATLKVVRDYRAGKKPLNFRSEIWSELKWHLFDMFHGKCAYCEGKTLHVAYGDVEHYRPKSKVDEDPTHSGYFWLAYDISNLLPSCGPCNQARGKMTHFPVEGERARIPLHVRRETPLLLDPYSLSIDPLDHLQFGPIGDATARPGSRFGESSRICYHLNRPGLSEARRTAVKGVRQDWNGLLAIFTTRAALKLASGALMQDIAAGEREYSAAQRCELERIIAENGI